MLSLRKMIGGPRIIYYLLLRETQWVFQCQDLDCAIVLTSSANAIVPKVNSEAYDTSKAALNHLVRELAIKLRPTSPSEWDRAGQL
jgi:NAD(P)-dependent dehydrogenase (short-subunit alcohol dehydrogenase family)